MVVEIPRNSLASTMPVGLDLADGMGSRPDMHPLVVVFGGQRDCVVRFGGLALPGSPDYLEIGVALPFVVVRGQEGVNLYVARMYAGWPPAVLAGNVHYGFSKEHADLRWDDESFVVPGRDGRDTVRVQARGDGSWHGGREPVSKSLGAALAMMALPVLGLRRDGMLVRSYFDWGVRDAQIRVATGEVSGRIPLAQGGPSLQLSHVSAEAFELRGVRWRLSWPHALYSHIASGEGARHG